MKKNFSVELTSVTLNIKKKNTSNMLQRFLYSFCMKIYGSGICNY